MLRKNNLYVKDPFESKYPLFVNGREKVQSNYENKIQRHLLIIHKQLMKSMKIQKTIIQ